jgi:hypothetical protein
VDRATRNHIKQKGYGDYFIHRTGHSIGTDVHSNGANMDDLEIHDERQILPNSCFSIEPGIYLAGVRRAQRSQYAGPAQVGGSHRQHSTRDRDHLMANSTTAKTKAAEPAQPASMMSVIAPAIGWLIPGAGHIIQKRWIRGLYCCSSPLELCSCLA